MADPPHKRPFDRKLIVLPLVALATAALVVVPAELVLRARYPDQGYDLCVNKKGALPHGRPGCVSRSKTAEGPWVDNRYNECGYRSPHGCGPKPPGTLRIAVLGSSTASGFLVPEPETLSGRLPAALTAACARPVEAQNLAVEGMMLDKLATSAKEAITLDPDVLVVVITSYDLEKATDKPARGSRLARQMIEGAKTQLGNAALFHMARAVVLSREKDYVARIAAQHHSAADIRADIADGVATLSAQLDRIVRLARRPIPIVLTFAPSRPEIVDARLTPGQPHPIDAALKKVARDKGILYASGLDTIPNDVTTASLFYVVNYHLNGLGHAYLSQAVQRRLEQSVPALEHCHST